VRSSGTINIYVNGVSGGSVALSTNYSDTAFAVGSSPNYGDFDGYISDFRLVKGTAVYTSNFTPPTAPLTAITNTALLLNFHDAGIYDLSGTNNLDTVGDARLGFAPIYGTGSIEFDGSGDALESPYDKVYAFSGDFTIELWIYYISHVGSYTGIIFCANTNTGSGAPTAGWILSFLSTGDTLLWEIAGSGGINATSNPLTKNRWVHLAVVRSGSTVTLYMDGVSIGTHTASGTIDSVSFPLRLGRGRSTVSTPYFEGYMDDIRITNGVARYTSNFTPPTEIDLALDTQAEYVTFFLDGDGPANGQNNTFTDSSTNGFTVTKNGDVTQGVFSPYGDNWSNYFDGSGDYLTISQSSSLDLGSGDFTVEAWIYAQSATQDSQFRRILATEANGSSAVQLYINTSGQVVYTANDVSRLTGTTNVLNGWHHIAVVRQGSSGGNIELYVDGSSEGSFTDTSSKTSSNFHIGKYPNLSGHFQGYISNIRMVKGTAVYTSSFTPSTSPLTNITNTSLLTCQSNRFADNSSNGFTISVNGDTKVTRFSPFESDKPYDIATDGGSGYFDGTGGYLDIAHDTTLTPSGDFTIEFWAYVTDSSNIQEWYSKGYGIQIYISSATWGVALSASNNSSYYFQDTTTAVVENVWTHVAVTRSGNTYRFFINGSEITSASSSSAPNTGTSVLRIGDWSGGTSYEAIGYISDVRYVNGSASYTSAFTPPTAPLTAVTNTELLLNFQDSAIPDLSGLNNIDTVGNAKVGGSDPTKYGTNAMKFDGSGDYLDTVSTEVLTFGTGDFTIEFWIHTSNNGNIMNPSTATGSGYWGLLMQSGNLRWNNSYAVTNLWEISASAIQDGSWHHVAISRASGSTKIFYDGTLQSTQADTTNYSGTGAWRIGSGNLAAFNGYLDDFRITKGVARYTSNFTPPSEALPKF
jgi:hypothetical protein